MWPLKSGEQMSALYLHYGSDVGNDSYMTLGAAFDDLDLLTDIQSAHYIPPDPSCSGAKEVVCFTLMLL